jgi:DNA-binding NarL/FixJ family response regulator
MTMVVDRCPSLIVVGVAEGLSDAVEQIRTERADVALVEIQMPTAEGLVTIAALRQQFPALRIVVCSFQKDSVTREAAKAKGADGYLVKPLHVEDLLALVMAPPPPPPAAA